MDEATADLAAAEGWERTNGGNAALERDGWLVTMKWNTTGTLAHASRWTPDNHLDAVIYRSSRGKRTLLHRWLRQPRGLTYTVNVH